MQRVGNHGLFTHLTSPGAKLRSLEQLDTISTCVELLPRLEQGNDTGKEFPGSLQLCMQQDHAGQSHDCSQQEQGKYFSGSTQFVVLSIQNPTANLGIWRPENPATIHSTRCENVNKLCCRLKSILALTVTLLLSTSTNIHLEQHFAFPFLFICLEYWEL